MLLPHQGASVTLVDVTCVLFYQFINLKFYDNVFFNLQENERKEWPQAGRFEPASSRVTHCQTIRPPVYFHIYLVELRGA